MKQKMNKMEKMALELATKAHRGQKRKYGSKADYITHPIAVYNILKVITNDSDVLCAGLLHDVLEDTKFKYSDLKVVFGTRVADLVNEVTVNECGKFPIKTREGLMIKIADILHNIHDNKSKKYLKKKHDFIMHNWRRNK